MAKLSDSEINFARAILQGRTYEQVPAPEVLTEAATLLRGWMDGELRMERPKLYDHYALLLLALIEQNQQLEARLAALERQKP